MDTPAPHKHFPLSTKLNSSAQSSHPTNCIKHSLHHPKKSFDRMEERTVRRGDGSLWPSRRCFHLTRSLSVGLISSFKVR